MQFLCKCENREQGYKRILKVRVLTKSPTFHHPAQKKKSLKLPLRLRLAKVYRTIAQNANPTPPKRINMINTVVAMEPCVTAAPVGKKVLRKFRVPTIWGGAKAKH